MPFIAAPMADAREDELVPEGEYELTIDSYEEKDGKKEGRTNLQIMITIDNPPAETKSPAPIFHYLSLPHEDDEPKSASFKLRMMRRFLEAFSIPFEDNGFDSDDLNGAKATLLVTQQEIMRGDPPRPTGEYSHALRLPKFRNERDEEEEKETPRRRRRA